MRSRRSSSAEVPGLASRRRSFRALAVPYILGALFVFGVFARALGDGEIRSGVFTYGLICAAAAFGLWRMRRWGRALALIVIVGNVGIGTLGLASWLFGGQDTLAVSLVLLGIGGLLGYAISRPTFNLPHE
jgi:hypothetical protein